MDDKFNAVTREEIEALAKEKIHIEMALNAYRYLNMVGVSFEELAKREVAVIELRKRLYDANWKIRNYIEAGPCE